VRTRGSSDADVRTFWCKKIRTFRNLSCVRKDKGVGQCGHISDKGGEGQFFAILCGRPLWKTPKKKQYTSTFNNKLFRKKWSCEIHLRLITFRKHLTMFIFIDPKSIGIRNMNIAYGHCVKELIPHYERK